jgi:hypothetical protein
MMNRGRRGASGVRARGQTGANALGQGGLEASEARAQGDLAGRAEIARVRGGGRIASPQALEQGLEALASGKDGHDVPAAAAPRADKHIDGEQNAAWWACMNLNLRERPYGRLASRRPEGAVATTGPRASSSKQWPSSPGQDHGLPQSALGPVAQRDVTPVFTDYGAGDREAKTDPARIAAA